MPVKEEITGEANTSREGFARRPRPVTRHMHVALGATDMTALPDSSGTSKDVLAELGPAARLGSQALPDLGQLLAATSASRAVNTTTVRLITRLALYSLARTKLSNCGGFPSDLSPSTPVLRPMENRNRHYA